MGRAPLQHPSIISASRNLLKLSSKGRILIAFLAALVFATLPSVSAMASTPTYVGSATMPNNDGYWLVTASGAVSASGTAQWLGDMNGHGLNKPIVGMAATPTGHGYWLVASDGGIFSFGDASFRGSTGSISLNKPIVGMASTPDAGGYWLVASDGGIFAFGDAPFYGSTGSIRLNKPIVGMAATSSGHGYWLVAEDGGIFAYGDAGFYGSTGSMVLNKPVTGMASTTTGHGYWLVGADGGVFSFGDAAFYGAEPSNYSHVIAIIKDSSGGYGVARSDGEFQSYNSDSQPVGGNGIDSNWVLENEEDFNGNSLNTGYWSTYSGTGNEGVGTRDPSTISVSNGELDITDHGTVGGGLCWCGSNTPPQMYGRWEVRAKMDVGTGYGPAILLWPDTAPWPSGGEIDMSEIPGGSRTQTNFTVHYGSNNSQTGTAEQGDFSQWHTFAMEWEPDHISYWLDGTLYKTITNPAAIPHDTMHLALQNDVGAAGHWIPAPDASTPPTVTFHVDWVKIFK